MANKCSRCKYFDGFYTRELTEFKKTHFGWCSVRAGSVDAREGCENFQRKKNCVQKGLLNRALKRRIGDLLTEISQPRQIAEEELDEKRERDEEDLR